MRVYSKSYVGAPGAWQVTDPLLSNVTILHVARNGTSHVETGNEEAGSLQFIYSSFSGSITFDPNNPFADIILYGEEGGFHVSDFEKIFVKWRV